MGLTGVTQDPLGFSSSSSGVTNDQVQYESISQVISIFSSWETESHLLRQIMSEARAKTFTDFLGAIVMPHGFNSGKNFVTTVL